MSSGNDSAATPIIGRDPALANAMAVRDKVKKRKQKEAREKEMAEKKAKKAAKLKKAEKARVRRLPESVWAHVKDQLAHWGESGGETTISLKEKPTKETVEFLEEKGFDVFATHTVKKVEISYEEANNARYTGLYTERCCNPIFRHEYWVSPKGECSEQGNRWHCGGVGDSYTTRVSK